MKMLNIIEQEKTMTKSSPEAIRRNFDQQMERFSNIETGQTTAIDSPLCMELVSQAAKLTELRC